MNRIYHCVPELNPNGGIYTYVQSLLKQQSSTVRQQVIYDLHTVDQRQCQLLHLHDPKLLDAVTGECPAIFTLHNHSTYCPSGTKYLTTRQMGCDRAVSWLGCTWGHLVEGCGSRRPANMIQGIQQSCQELSQVNRLKIPMIAISHYARQQLIRHGVPPEQVTTVHHGVETAPTSAPLTRTIHQARRLLFVGRLVPYKGLDWLLHAMTQVDSSIHLDVAGDGWYRDVLHQLADRLGISHRITWHGWCQGEALDALYEQAYAVVFPSVWPEPAGIITLEAYARQRPIIASAMGGIPEYVRHQETGLLVTAHDTTALAAAIAHLTDNYAISQQMGIQGYAWFLQEFTMEHHTKALQTVYTTIIANFSRTRSSFISARINLPLINQ